MSEQMTLEQVRDALLELAESFDKAFPGRASNACKWADAIDAHLNAAKGEVVAWWCAIESVEAIDGTEEIAMSWNADDGNAGEAARTEANQWINDQPHPGNFHLAKVYTNPASPDVVRDAERFQFMLNEHCCVQIVGNDYWLWWPMTETVQEGRFNSAREAIDAAMAAREGGK